MTLTKPSNCMAQDAIEMLKDASREDFVSLVKNHPAVIDLQNLINYQFKNINHLVMALTHTSAAHESTSLENFHNERLEFLGDGLLGSIVCSKLFLKFESFREGQLSKFKGSLVNENALFDLAQLIGLNKCVILGKGVYSKSGITNKAISADAFEALLAAIYLDSNQDEVSSILDNIWNVYHQKTGREFFDEEKLIFFDAKSYLQELCAKNKLALPEYKILFEGDQDFTLSLIVGNETFGPIEGNSKKEIKKQLAHTALNKLDPTRSILC